MRKSIFTQVAGVLLATLFFASCSSLQLSNSSQSKRNKSVASDSLDTSSPFEVDAAKTARELYNQAFSLYEEAQQLKSTERISYYGQMRDNLYQADSLAAVQGDEKIKENALKLLQFCWLREHNEAVSALENSMRYSFSPEDYEIAIGHASNASFVLPDSIKTYEVAAQLCYKAGDVQAAIHQLEMGLNVAKDFSETTEQRIQKKLAYLQEHNSSASNIALSPNLPAQYKEINQALNQADYDKAVGLIQAELSKYPEHKNLKRSLALAQFKRAEIIFNTGLNSGTVRRSGYRVFSSKEKKALTEGDRLLQLSEEMLLQLQEDNVYDMSLIEQIASFYKTAAHYYQKLTRSNWLPSYAYDLRVSTYLNKSANYYTELAEESNDRRYWLKVHEIYLALGENKKADVALNKAGQ